MSMIQKTFSVSDISIQVSADTIEKRIRTLGGVGSVSVSIENHTMTVTYDDDLISANRIIQAVREAGYQAYLQEPSQPQDTPEAAPNAVNRTFIVQCAAALASLVCSYIPYGAYLSCLIALLSFFTARDVCRHVAAEIRSRHIPGETSAVLLAVLSTLCGLYLLTADSRRAAMFFTDSCCALAFAVLIRSWMISRRQILARQDTSLRSGLPKTAAVYEDHREKVASVADLKVDQIIVIRPGEIVPADGRVQKGFAVMDESALTGWDRPVEKNVGSYVYANSRCLKGSVAVRTERVGNTTAMMKLAEMAERTAADSSFRSPFRSFTKNLFLYTLFAALFSGIGWYYLRHDSFFAISTALAVLACSALPALSMTSANAVMNAARSAAAGHILFRSVDALEMTGKIDQLIMRQNNTVTERDLTVTDFIPAQGISEQELEYLVYALESRSDAPFSRAVIRYLKTRRIAGIDAREFSRLSSRGRRAVQSMSRYRSGLLDDVISRGIDTSGWEEEISRLRKEGKRILVYTEEERIIGMVAAVRPILPKTAEALKELQDMGIDICLLSDGSEDEALRLQEELALENVIHDPARYETERLFRRLSEANIISAWLSDHDDCLPSVSADVTAVIGTGADTGPENSGLLLTRNRLGDFVKAVSVSRSLNERIQSAQIMVIAYHALAVSLFGFILPQFFPQKLPLLIPMLCSAAAIHAASRFR